MLEDKKNIGAALLRAKAKFVPTGKSGENKFKGYKYAILADIYGAVEDALHSEGIIIVHKTECLHPEFKEILHTILWHVQTGETIEDKRFLNSEMPGNQGRGAAETYSRRYAVLSLCGIAPEEDDDCAKEQEYIEAKVQKERQDLEKIRPNHVAFLESTVKDYPDLKASILRRAKVSELADLPAHIFNQVLDYAKNEIKKIKENQ